MAQVDGSELLSAYVVNILEVPTSLEDVDGAALASALVVLRRQSGALLAVPAGVLSPEVLAAALNAEEEDQLGCSTQILVAAGTFAQWSSHNRKRAFLWTWC